MKRFKVLKSEVTKILLVSLEQKEEQKQAKSTLLTEHFKNS